MKKRRYVPENQRKVVQVWPLGLSNKPEGAQAYLDTMIANDQIRGIFIVVMLPDGSFDFRSFGTLTKQDCSWIATKAQKMAMMGWTDE